MAFRSIFEMGPFGERRLYCGSTISSLTLTLFSSAHCNTIYPDCTLFVLYLMPARFGQMHPLSRSCIYLWVVSLFDNSNVCTWIYAEGSSWGYHQDTTVITICLRNINPILRYSSLQQHPSDDQTNLQLLPVEQREIRHSRDSRSL